MSAAFAKKPAPEKEVEQEVPFELPAAPLFSQSAAPLPADPLSTQALSAKPSNFAAVASPRNLSSSAQKADSQVQSGDLRSDSSLLAFSGPSPDEFVLNARNGTNLGGRQQQRSKVKVVSRAA